MEGRQVGKNSDSVALILYKVYADLRAEAARTYAGFLWWIVDPIVSMGVYYFVFKVVLNRGTENYVAFLFVGLVPWRWLATTTMHGSNSILGARSVMQQAYLPKYVFPLVAIFTDSAKFLVVFVIVVALVLISGFPISIAFIALPFLIFVQLIFITGVAILCAAITPFVPDIRMVLENIIRLWMFLSGVFFAVNELSPAKQAVFRLNPMTIVIESYRQILMYGEMPDFSSLIIILALSTVLVAMGLAVVNRYDHTYPKLAN